MDINTVADYVSMLADPETSTPEITALAQALTNQKKAIIIVAKNQEETHELLGELISAYDALDKKVTKLSK